MSKNVIIFTNDNGGVSVCIPTGKLDIEQVQAKDIPAGVDSYIVRADSLPEQDNDFFDAWEQTKGVVTVNLDKAREITKRRLRTEREPLMQALDVKFQRALEEGEDYSAIVAEKKRLRAFTDVVDSVDTLDGLRALKITA